jgi:hypothetical protein
MTGVLAGLRLAIIGILCVAAMVSVTQGYRNAMENSQDFQWSPTVILIRHGEDPYQEFKKKPEQSRLILSQIPTYSHFTYLMLAPIAFLNFKTAKIVWAILNLIFATTVFLLLQNRFDRKMLFILYLLFLCSTPLRNSIGNGQQSLLCLFFYVSAISLTDHGYRALASGAAGFGSFKFSFGVPLVAAVAFDHWKYVFIYLIPTLVGVLFWILFFHHGLVETLFLPLSVSQTAIGAADLLSVLRQSGFSQAVSMGLPLLFLCVVAVIQWLWFPIDDVLDRVAFYALVSLLLIYHSSYDQVFLLLCLVRTINSKSYVVQIVTWAVVGYFWYGLKVMSLIVGWDSWTHMDQGPLLWINHISLWVLFGTLIFDVRKAGLERLLAPQDCR